MPHILSADSIPIEEKEPGFSNAQKQAEALEAKYAEKQKGAEPLPLQRELPPSKPFPFAALGPVLGPVAKRLHEVIKAPDSVCGQSVLAAAALIVQPYADIHIDGRIHPLSLFMLTVAESGDRKSAVDNVVLKAVRDYEKMLKHTFETDSRVFKNKMEVWKKMREQAMRDSDLENLEGVLNELAPEPMRPLEPNLLLEEPTYEGLIKLFAIGQPSLGLFSDEGGRMFGGHGMGKDNMLKTICGLSNLWDGKPITRIRGGDENLLLYGRRFSTHLMIQEVVLSTILENDLLVGQGMLARCLIVSPPTNAGNRPYNPVDISKDPIILEFWDRSSKILDQPFPLSKPGMLNELAPRPLVLSPAAKECWVRFHDEIDQCLKPDGPLRVIRRTANKIAEQALRIAGVFALIEELEIGSISLEVIQRAIELARFYLDEALRIVETSASNPELELAQAVIEWMRKKAPHTERDRKFTLQEIYQRAGPRGVRNQKTAKRVMAILEEHKTVVRLSREKWEWKLVD